MMGALDNMLGLLFPPFCVHCSRLLEYNSKEALCADCKEMWEDEKVSVCKDCFKSVDVCECLPHRASKKIKKAFHIAEYHPSEESVARSFIITCKDNDYKAVYGFVADELESALRARFRTFKNAVITYVPRKRASVLEKGIDQAQIVAKELALRLDIEYVDAIKRCGGKEQKALDSRERMENARQSFKANEDAILAVASRAVILYDDIMTTGASVSACAEILKNMGARTVYVITFGRAYRKGKPLSEREEDNAKY